MRIVAGKNKGNILKSPKGLSVRPTSEKVREALFDILGTSVR
ncbi:MAG: RsmD family RNA methyltransferase, partial [Atribacterota bacterium]